MPSSSAVAASALLNCFTVLHFVPARCAVPFCAAANRLLTLNPLPPAGNSVCISAAFGTISHLLFGGIVLKTSGTKVWRDFFFDKQLLLNDIYCCISANFRFGPSFSQ